MGAAPRYSILVNNNVDSINIPTDGEYRLQEYSNNTHDHGITHTSSPSRHNLRRFILPESAKDWVGTTGEWSGPPIQNVECLNWSSIPELRAHNHLLSPEQRGLISVLTRKSENKKKKTDTEENLAQPALLAMCGVYFAGRVAQCGNKGAKAVGLCDKNKFCDYCSYLAVKDKLKTFLPHADDKNFLFATLSFKGRLGYFNGTDVYDWYRYWDACKQAVKRLVDSERILGALCREELDVDFLPTTVLPHVHAILHVEDLKTDDLRPLLRAWVEAYRDDNGLGLALEPTIKIQSCATTSDFVRRVRYILKPLKIAEAYDEAWQRIDPFTRAEAPALNHGVREFLEGCNNSIFHRPQIKAYGSFSHKNPHHWGVAPKGRAKYNTLVLDALREASQWCGADEEETVIQD